MRALYSAVLYMLAPWVFVRLAWRSLRAPEYRRRWPERLALYSAAAPRAQGCIWVHAVSVGEVQAAIPLVRALLQRHPGTPVLITTTTPTGSARVRALFAEHVLHIYAPYDLPGAVRRFLARFQPRLAVIMETEIWPNLFAGCRARGIPVLVANARLSARSAAGYARVGRLTRATLADITVLAAQGTRDARRFRALGMDPERIRVTGSIKFELRLPASLREQAEVLRGMLGRDRPIWIAASTHEGEDEQVLDALARLHRALPDALLVLVPRHPERFARVAALCRKRGFETVTRSEGRPCERSTQVYVGDTLGELPLMYAACDVGFVGGSLVPTGGHNPLEPAALGLAILTGPQVFNFQEITDMLVEVGAARTVSDSAALADTLEALLRDANAREAMGQKGRRLVEANRGALKRLLGIVDEAGVRLEN